MSGDVRGRTTRALARQTYHGSVTSSFELHVPEVMGHNMLRHCTLWHLRVRSKKQGVSRLAQTRQCSRCIYGVAHAAHGRGRRSAGAYLRLTLGSVPDAPCPRHGPSPVPGPDLGPDLGPLYDTP